MLTTVLQNFGQSISEVSFWIGAGSVLLFSQNRFRIQSTPPDTLDPPVHARSLTTRFRYGIGQFTYMSIYWAVFVVLVCCGSIPEFQKLLVKLLGQAVLDGKDPVASPTWAALVATAVLPSVPGFNVIDRKLRTFLHDISSIPTKGHHLAKDILNAVLAEQTSPPAAYETLCRVMEGLATRDLTTRVRLFSAFRREHQEFLEDIHRKFSTSRIKPAGQDLRINREESENQTAPRPSDRKENEAEQVYLQELLLKFCRFLSCALLSSQPDEQTARKRLTQLGIKLDQQGWQFRIQQIFVSMVVVSLVTLASGFIVTGITVLAKHFQWFSPAGDLAGSTAVVGTIAWAGAISSTMLEWVIFAVPMFTLPLVFTAGIKLYLVDRERYASDLNTKTLPWEDRFLINTLVFSGSFFLACFPVLLRISHLITDQTNPAIIPAMVTGTLVWGLPPALFALIFIKRTSIRFGPTTRNSWWRFFGNFLWHGLPVGLLSIFLVLIFIRPVQGESSPFHPITPFLMRIMIGCVGLLVAGLLGAINCYISRDELARERPEDDEEPVPEGSSAPDQASANDSPLHQEPAVSPEAT